MKCKDCFYYDKLVHKQKNNEKDICQDICRIRLSSERLCYGISNVVCGGVFTHFPFIDAENDWCGEFKEKKQNG